MCRGPLDQNLVGYCFFRLAGAVLPHIPARVAYPIATLMGDLCYWLLPGRWAGVAHNVSHVLGKPLRSPPVRSVVRQVCRNLAYNFYDLFRVPRLTKEQIAELVEVEGWEHIEAARSAGRGMVLTAPHFGNLDIVMQVAAVRSLPLTMPAEHLQPECLFQYVCSLRASHGMLRLVPVDGPLLELFRALRRNEGVALAADRDVSGSGCVVDFFGVPALLPDSHVRLALRTGAGMVAGFSYRRPGGRFLLRLFAVPLEGTGDGDGRVDRGMEALVSLLEERIGADPGQWVLTVPLWGRRWRDDRSEDEDRPDLPV
jgi:lauroyl/myristoyl acyltransferase